MDHVTFSVAKGSIVKFLIFVFAEGGGGRPPYTALGMEDLEKARVNAENALRKQRFGLNSGSAILTAPKSSSAPVTSGSQWSGGEEGLDLDQAEQFRRQRYIHDIKFLVFA